jgi:hypothetical protein
MQTNKNRFQFAKGRLSSFLRTAAIPAAIAVAGGALAGCTAEVAPAVAPVGYYDSYPSTDYEGRTVYYIDGRWTYLDGNRWYYYRHVPSGLERRRASLHYSQRSGHGGGPRPRRP